MCYERVLVKKVADLRIFMFHAEALRPQSFETHHSNESRERHSTST